MADGTPKRDETSEAAKDSPSSGASVPPEPTPAAHDAAPDDPTPRAARRRGPAPLVAQRSLGGRALVVGACFVILVAGMKASREILVPFLFSLFIAVLAGPPIQAMKKRGIPTGLAMLVVLGVLGLGGLFVATVVTRSITSFEDKLPTYNERVAEAKEQLEAWVANAPDELLGWIGLSSDADGDVEGAADGEVAAAPDEDLPETSVDGEPLAEGDDALVEDPTLSSLDDVFDLGALSKTFFNTVDLDVVLNRSLALLSEAAGLVTNAALILLTVIFLLLESSTLPRKILAISGDNGRELLERIGSVADDVNRYMALKTFVSLITGVTIWVWLSWLRVDFALLWGLLAFLLNFIPNLGSILAGIPAVLLALIQLGPTTAGLATLGYVAVNGFVGNVVEPRMLGQGLGLSTLVVFLSLIFWGWVLGAAGMLLSVPLTMACKVALQSSGDMRWVAILLSGDPAKEQMAMRAARASGDAAGE